MDFLPGRGRPAPGFGGLICYMANQPCKATVHEQDPGYRQRHLLSWILPEHDGLMDLDPASSIPQHTVIRYDGVRVVRVAFPPPLFMMVMKL